MPSQRSFKPPRYWIADLTAALPRPLQWLMLPLLRREITRLERLIEQAYRAVGDLARASLEAVQRDKYQAHVAESLRLAHLSMAQQLLAANMSPQYRAQQHAMLQHAAAQYMGNATAVTQAGLCNAQAANNFYGNSLGNILGLGR